MSDNKIRRLKKPADSAPVQEATPAPAEKPNRASKSVAPVEKAAPAKVAKVEKPAKAAPPAKGKAAPAEKPAPATKIVKGKVEKAEKPAVKNVGGARGSDQRYKVLTKETPFREGTIRGDDGRWELIRKNTSTAAVRAENKRCGKKFFDEIEKAGHIEYLN